MASAETTVPASLFFYNPVRGYYAWARDNGIILNFDLILTETHNLDSMISQHAVEDGSSITDYIYNQLERGSLSCLISNFSISEFGLAKNRAQSAFDNIVQLHKERALFTLATVMRVYENIAFSSVTVERSAESGEALTLAITFQRIKTVKLKKVLIDASIKLLDMNSNANRQAAPKADVGRSVGVQVRTPGAIS